MQHRPPSPPGPSIPGLGGPPDAARLRLMRRMLAECASLVEDRVFGLPRPASHGALLGGAASRSAVASLASCGLLPASAASDISSAVLAGGLSLATALPFASDMAESLMSAKVVPLRGSCGPVESALIPGLVRKAAALTAEVAVLDAFAATAAASLASCLGPRRRVGEHMDRRETLARATAAAAALRTERDRLLREAAQAEAREPAAGLERRVLETRDDYDRRRQQVETLERDHPEDTAPAMLARVQRYDQAIQGRREAVQKLREDRSALRARIAQEGGLGLGEQIAALERDQDLLTRERDADAREVEVLTLLRDTLLDAEREVKASYFRPVVQRIAPYLRGLFPGAGLACNEDFQVETLSRSARGDEPFGTLSDGTQEQVSILARLAFAEMLHDQGRPALLVFDDALAYSDADRMERMFDVLTQAGNKLQILVFTCRSDLFSRLGGTALTLETVD